MVTSRRALDRFGGLALSQRVVRTLKHLGSERIQLVVGGEVTKTDLGTVFSQQPQLAEDSVVELAETSVTSSDLLKTVGEDREPFLVVPGDFVFDQRILEACLQSTGPAVCVDSDPPQELGRLVQCIPMIGGARYCGPMVVTTEWLEQNPGDVVSHIETSLAAGGLSMIDVDSLSKGAPNLRREMRPFWFPGPEGRDRRRARDLLLASTQKGSLDLPAMVHAPIEKFIAWALAGTKISPNMVTVLTTLVAWVATAMFAQGNFGFGLALALAVGVLDGVDGKLARLRFEFSRFGELEHWLDFFYEWSWWAAMAYYFSRSGLLPDAWRYFGLLALFEIVDGLAKLINIRSFGRLIDEMSPFEGFVRVIGGRRNVYIWLMTVGAIVGKPEVTYQVLPFWQGLTALLHWIRLPWLLLTVPRQRSAKGFSN